jgi:general secretion pathway protein G
MKRAFSLVELMIVVALLGILAAIVVPQFQSHTTQAKEAAAESNLQIVRGAIELYAAQHNGVPPGYLNDDPSTEPAHLFFVAQLTETGNYLSNFPKNPFNEGYSTKMISNDEDFPTEPVQTDLYGWIYKPATKTIKLNWAGTDSTGVAYFDY